MARRKSSRSKLKALSTLSVSIFEVIFASLIVPVVFGFDKANWLVLIFGLVTFILSGYLTLIFADRGKL